MTDRAARAGAASRSHVVGLDIGGANLKGASTSGIARSESFEIWRAPEELAGRVQRLLERFGTIDRLAVTMTAELADCFETKRAGVEFILQAVIEAAGTIPVVVWLTSGTFVVPSIARERPREAAAANWHALATWAGQSAPAAHSLLIDIGSTTTDLIPLVDGIPSPSGWTDVERLASGELVYTGYRRTPVCAVAAEVPFRGSRCALAAEWFATMIDVYLILGWIPEDTTDLGTANGRPATISCAHDRLARAICGDRTEVLLSESRTMSQFLAERQMEQIIASVEKLKNRSEHPIDSIILSGAGEFLARRILEKLPPPSARRMLSLSDMLSPELAQCACAYAVALLAASD
jgi:probable H4MPT-linked C1 transfer pathway protein